ncbi:MAG: DUF4362 domain-containing protein [Nitrosarchaeum sp.]|nr:DUF4362 domain-containing protein [Nitrosarchaeum sp.]
MKTIPLIIIILIAISVVAVLFVILPMIGTIWWSSYDPRDKPSLDEWFDSHFQKEHYDIEITGMKDVYLLGEQYDFSYVISGYGHECGSKKVTFPDSNGDTTGIYSSSSCVANAPMKNFVFDIQKEQGTTFGHVTLNKAGHYIVAVEFEQNSNFEPTQKGHDFFVVEKICNDISDAEEQAKCLVDSLDSCESAYLAQRFPDNSGGTVSVVAVVESWNDCRLRVYTENSLGEHTPYNGIRSICNIAKVDGHSLLFEECNNAEYPPISLTSQNSKHCNNSVGQPDFECFVDSFERCNPATISVTRHTIEGDPIFFSGIVIAKDDSCFLDFVVDTRQDRYSSQEIEHRICSDVTLDDKMFTFHCDDGGFGVSLK